MSLCTDVDYSIMHLFEFGDERWFPQILRDAETAYLAISYRIEPLLARPWAERISTVLNRGKPTEILDLCSGSGGALPWIIDELEKCGYEVRATLTDFYPNPNFASHPRMVWLAEPVDAARVPPKLAGVRTMFSAFHHFRPSAAKAILKDAFDHRRAICIFESESGGLLAAVWMIWIPLAVLTLMPFARPFRWAYLVFTYLIPLMPLILLWDSMVSVLRIYSPEQMKKLTEDLQASDYNWEIGRIQVMHGIRGLPYLIGRPIP
jgi:hypothetical protein